MDHQDPDELLSEIAKQMQRLSGELSGAGPKLARSQGWIPNVDIFECEHSLVLKAELAGVSPDKVTLHYNSRQGTLTLRGWRTDKQVFPGERMKAHQIEIEYGEFQREILLPELPIDVERAKAQCKSGFLLLVVPKVEPDQQPVIIKKTIIIERL